MWLLIYCYYFASTSIDSNVSPPIVSLSGFRQISIMLYVARSLLKEHVAEKINKLVLFYHSASFLAKLKFFKALFVLL